MGHTKQRFMKYAQGRMNWISNDMYDNSISFQDINAKSKITFNDKANL